MKSTPEQIHAAIGRERAYQQVKWGANRQQSIPGWLLILKKKVNDAISSWYAPGDPAALREVLQVGAVAQACMEEHGFMERAAVRNGVMPPELNEPAENPPPRFPLLKLGQEINAINAANGWDVLKPEDWPVSYSSRDVAATEVNAVADDQSRKVTRLGTALMLITTEVAEAMEAVRVFDKANFSEELADVIIRTLDVATGLGIDLDAAIAAKLEKNKTRGIRHGGKAV